MFVTFSRSTRFMSSEQRQGYSQGYAAAHAELTTSSCRQLLCSDAKLL